MVGQSVTRDVSFSTVSFPLLPQCQPPRLHPHPGTFPSFPAPSLSHCPSHCISSSLFPLCSPVSPGLLSLSGVSLSPLLSPGLSPCWFFGSVFLFSGHFHIFPLRLWCLPPSPHSCSSVSGSPPSLGGPGLPPLPQHAPPGLAGVGARSGGCDQAGKGNPSRHDIYVRTSKWRRA